MFEREREIVCGYDNVSVCVCEGEVKRVCLREVTRTCLCVCLQCGLC